ncbi:phytoene desaturase family protein [Plebeiibacterium sediminum]|uniref:NAD(P)/FAD-dependent oxidoreductase n=1 Tax=Plebeiibacterium sediminum TaxID=2992112 RepID=A0AAE3M2C4_9BACT|nr:NAD(P)/FAD-dependent oxidoreductase [Plebeiobacterium sediminum]MCW3785562.1 NAD(P)/FAD-dependent oxidoreductase [Plebeiobacterium sediminum]
MNSEHTFDIAIIGSGLGGLACGSILSQQGYKVCILEQHYQIGGCLQDFKRQGVVFDTGMHYIGSYENGQILNTLFRYFGIYDKIQASRLSENGFDVINIAGEEFALPQGVVNFKKKLVEHFPDESKAIDTYFNKLQDIYDSVDLINLRDIPTDDLPRKKGLDENVFEFVFSITANVDLQNILCGLNSLYAGKKESASLFIHSIITLFYLQSAYKLDGGGGQIARAFKSVIERNGGVIRTKAKAEVLKCEEGEVKSLILASGEEIKAKQYISNIDPLTTMEMLEGANIRKVFIKRLREQEQTTSCFSVYIKLKEKTFNYLNANYYYYDEKNVWALDSYSVENWPQGYMIYFSESDEFRGFAENITIISPMDFAEMKPWENTGIENRGASYLKMKEDKAELLIQMVEKTYPEIRSCIEEMFTSSPLTFRDYTGVRRGAMYGVLTDSRNPYDSQIMPKTRVKNLFLTGQNVNMHGVLGVSVAALLTCGEIMGMNKIMSDLRKHVVKN